MEWTSPPCLKVILSETFRVSTDQPPIIKPPVQIGCESLKPVATPPHSTRHMTQATRREACVTRHVPCDVWRVMEFDLVLKKIPL